MATYELNTNYKHESLKAEISHFQKQCEPWFMEGLMQEVYCIGTYDWTWSSTMTTCTKQNVGHGIERARDRDGHIHDKKRAYAGSSMVQIRT